jgi:SNF2 family DNA or RNA helicase
MAVGRGNQLLSLTMGAGKTVCAVASIEELVDNGALQQGLVFVPSALKYQWQEQIKRFTGLNALVIDGTKGQRDRLYKHVPKFRYTIIGYDSVVGKDWRIIRDDLPFDFLVADEATVMKGFTAARSKRIKFLSKRSDVNIALTGQPIENRPEELFSIMEFVDPTVLGDFRVYDRAYIVRDGSGRAVRFRNLDKLNAKLADVFYRKTREEIKDQFPKVQTSMLPVRFTATEAALHRMAAEYTLRGLKQAAEQYGEGFNLAVHYGKEEAGGAAQRIRGEIMSGILAMRLIADDPLLLRHSAMKYAKTKGKEGSSLADRWKAEGRLDRLPPISSKRALLVDRLREIFEEYRGNKVVIFSFFKEMLNLVEEDTLPLARSVQFTGDMTALKKRDAMRQFKQDSATRLFLSSDAGGYGVDLPEANYLISLDLPWSTGKMEQRDGRIIRISSEWDHVDIMSLLVDESIEMWMWSKINAKRGVSSAFLDGKFDSAGRYTPDMRSLTKHLEEILG